MADPVNWSNLTNWDWKAVVALAALVLSQLPPLIPRIRRGKLKIQTYERLAVSHFIGNPGLQLLLHLENTGGRQIRVVRMIASVTRGPEKFSLTAANYLERQDSTSTLILAPFKLEANAEWQHIVNFEFPLESHEEKATKALVSEMRADLLAKRETLTAEEKTSKYVDCEPNVLARANDMFKQRFKWNASEYHLDLTIETEPPKATTVRRYRFTLWESDSFDLRALTDDYSKGFGVCLPAKAAANVPTKLSERAGK